MRPHLPWPLAAFAGIAAAVLGVGLGELSAALIATSTSPVVAVGGLMVDVAPAWAKDTAIALFGTNDKVALIVGVALVLVAVAATAGVVESRKAPWGRVILGLMASFGALAVITRTPFSQLDILPALIALAGSVISLPLLLRRKPEAKNAPLDRRRFLAWAGASVAVGVVASIAGAGLQAGSRVATVIRNTFKLPQAAVMAAAVPAGADLGIVDMPPLVTPNADFYRIDTALRVPIVNPEEWSLRIHGEVENEITLTWEELIGLPLEESVTTLACVSNEVGGDLIGNALWLGYPIRKILERAVPKSGADMVLSTSVDGWSASTPIEALTDDRNAILAIGMNGEPLPLEHGFPVRMVVPGLFGYVSATKWVVDLEVTRFANVHAYWTDRGWSALGPIKIGSRIDVPRSRDLDAGPTVVAGFAWQQHTGISAVEVQIDDNAWQQASLASAISVDTWVQWKFDWDASPGSHTVRVRATDADGNVQTADRVYVAPDGATGHDEKMFSVS